MNVLKLGVLAASLALAGQANASSLIVNGDFESQTFVMPASNYYNIGSGEGETRMPDNPVPADFGFQVQSNNIDIIRNGAFTPFYAAGGNYHIDLVGYGSTGAIFQPFHTDLGKLYSLTLDYNVNGAGGAEININSLEVGSIIGSSTWQTFSTTFVGIGAPTTLNIVSIFGGNNGGIVLDNIAVNEVGAVPEPATWAMLIGGFGMAGAAMRRRRPVTA